MPEVLTTPRFQMLKREFNPDLLSEQLAFDYPPAQFVARALFETGLLILAMATRKSFRCEKEAVATRVNKHYLVLNLQGYVEMEIEGEIYPVMPGQLGYCPPNRLMNRRGKQGEICSLLYFRFENNEYWEGLNAAGPYVKDYDAGDHMYYLSRRLLDAHQARDERSLQFARSEAHMLVTVLNRLRYPSAESNPRVLALRSLADEIRQRPEDDWTQESMARRLSMSSRTFHRHFQQEYGLPPVAWVIQERMTLALELLARTPLPIKDIALKCGYQSVHSFMRLFKKSVGIPPGQYRALHSQALAD